MVVDCHGSRFHYQSTNRAVRMLRPGGSSNYDKRRRNKASTVTPMARNRLDLLPGWQIPRNDVRFPCPTLRMAEMDNRTHTDSKVVTNGAYTLTRSIPVDVNEYTLPRLLNDEIKNEHVHIGPARKTALTSNADDSAWVGDVGSPLSIAPATAQHIRKDCNNTSNGHGVCHTMTQKKCGRTHRTACPLTVGWCWYSSERRIHQNVGSVSNRGAIDQAAAGLDVREEQAFSPALAPSAQS